MYENGPVSVVNKKMSALGVLFAGATLVVVTVILSVTGVALYTMHIVNIKTNSLGDFFGAASDSLDGLRENLPPALSDAWRDARRPDYLDNTKIGVHLAGKEEEDRRVIVEITNNGDEVVTLLSLRVICLDEEGDAVDEISAWAATPLQIEDEWRGPILPHTTRHFTLNAPDLADVKNLTYEVSDIRVWRGAQGDGEAGGPATPQMAFSQ